MLLFTYKHVINAFQGFEKKIDRKYDNIGFNLFK